MTTSASHTQSRQENVNDDFGFGHVQNVIAQGGMAHLSNMSSLELFRSSLLQF